MMLAIKINLVPTSLWPLKCTYPMSPTRIVIHNTANDASAEDEIAYMHNNPDATSYHYAVDDKGAVQGLMLDRNGWHAGDGATGIGNREGIGVEICYSKSGGARFESAQENAATLCAMLMKEFEWGLDLSRVTKHEDYSGKHCPHRTLDDYGWDYFLTLVKTKYEESYPEEIPMTDAERKEYDEKITALEARLKNADDKISTLSEALLRTQGKIAPCVTSVNWNAHVTPDMGGEEAVNMLNTMVKNGDFNGIDSAHYGLSAQMVRLMLIFYRMLKRLFEFNNLRWQ